MHRFELWRWQRRLTELACNKAQGGQLRAIVFLPRFVAVVAHYSLNQGVKVDFDNAYLDLCAQIKRTLQPAKAAGSGCGIKLSGRWTATG